jgi:phosphohistidine phosphatase
MDLILWRHADAEDGMPDLGRELTPKGRKQAEQIAQWLKPRLPKDARILVSPAQRSQQTAQALTTHFDTVQEVSPGASYRDVLTAAGWPDQKGAVVIVGHQPTLGQVAAWVLSGEPEEWSIKKGALWWLSYRARDAQEHIVLKAVMTPELA